MVLHGFIPLFNARKSLIVAASSYDELYACRRPSFVRPKEAKANPGLKKNLIAYAADARWDELKPYARPARQGNSPSFIGLILAPADFSKGRLAK